MIKVLYFAKTREIIGQMSDSVEVGQLPSANAEALRAHLADLSETHAKALNVENLLVAINQNMVPMSSEVKAGDEVAFFPPVTGG